MKYLEICYIDILVTPSRCIKVDQIKLWICACIDKYQWNRNHSSLAQYTNHQYGLPDTRCSLSTHKHNTTTWSIGYIQLHPHQNPLGLLRNRVNFLSTKTQLKTSMLLQHLLVIGNSSQLICSINDTRVYDTSTTLEDKDAICCSYGCSQSFNNLATT
jgi:hypothetical protein